MSTYWHCNCDKPQRDCTGCMEDGAGGTGDRKNGKTGTIYSVISTRLEKSVGTSH